MRDSFLATKASKIWTIMSRFKYKSIHVGLQDVSEHALQKRVIYLPKIVIWTSTIVNEYVYIW